MFHRYRHVFYETPFLIKSITVSSVFEYGRFYIIFDTSEQKLLAERLNADPKTKFLRDSTKFRTGWQIRSFICAFLLWLHSKTVQLCPSDRLILQV